MRYFLIIFGLCVIAIMGVLGKRGSHFRKPPLYIFPDMERQLKLRPQKENGFFTNGLSSQLPVESAAGMAVFCVPVLASTSQANPTHQRQRMHAARPL